MTEEDTKLQIEEIIENWEDILNNWDGYYDLSPIDSILAIAIKSPEARDYWIDKAMEELDECKQTEFTDSMMNYKVIPFSQAKAKLQALKVKP